MISICAVVCCVAATYVDRRVFGVDHMYFPANGGDTSGNDMTFQRMPECSTCSPGKCWNLSAETTTIGSDFVDHTAGDGGSSGSIGRVGSDRSSKGPGMPAWCNEAPFDPEGSVSSLNAILSTVIGCHFGHVFVQIKGHAARLYHMVLFSLLQLVFGLVLHFSGGIKMNTDLYSFSYVLVSGGAGGIMLSICYFIVDCKRMWVTSWTPFKFFGMNAITMYSGKYFEHLKISTEMRVSKILAECWQSALPSLPGTAKHPANVASPWWLIFLLEIFCFRHVLDFDDGFCVCFNCRYILAEGGIPDTLFSLFYLDDTNATAPPYNSDQNLQNVLWPTGVYWGDQFDGGLGRAETVSHNPSVAVFKIC